MKYGIIGTGWIAESFISGARKLCNAEIAAVYSRTSEKGNAFAEKNGIPFVYTDLDDFALGDFDAVYIASPNSLHSSQTEKMLLSGKHVICEKPVTVTPGELIENQSIAAQKGLIYMEAIMYMHTPHRELLRSSLEKLGRITSAHFDFSQFSSKYPAYVKGGLPNIFNPAMATGCLMDLGVYCVYPCIELFGVPQRITADAAFLDTGADHSGAAMLNYEDKIVTLTYSKTGQDHSGSEIFGDRGTFITESISKLVCGKIIYNDGSTEEVFPDMEKDVIMGYEALDFEKFIQGRDLNRYEMCCKMSLLVSRMMYEIREKAGIRFDKED